MLPPPLPRRPQNPPDRTDPLTVRASGSIRTSASSLPLRELDVRKSRFAGLPCGNAIVPIPARVVAAKSVATPLASASR